MKQTWRWFGPKDPVSLLDIKQTGATGIVSALHYIKNGEVWPIDDILKHKITIEDAGLQWSVVESVPIHEDIKTRSGNYKTYINNYRISLQNLAQCGITTVCYNFMPVLDWTRTSLDYELKDGSKALRFDVTAFAAFELYILKRDGATSSYSNEEQEAALLYFKKLSEAEITKLSNTIIAGLPGTEEGYSLEQFQKVLNTYSNINAEQLKINLVAFLKEIIPTAAENNINMCIHPDDPPRSILGLPRVVSTEADFDYLVQEVPNKANGITFCTGSLGVHPDNDLPKIFKKYADRIYFLHLRNTLRDAQGNFHEANHLEGDTDMFDIVSEVIKEEKRRKSIGRSDSQIPMRPDHGHQMLDDLNKNTNPGYSGIGRLRGLAELRGLELGIYRNLI
ncbi:MAG: mannonate dehydratase [Polaribacter sp.]|uniref:mannonate dehydratase n=1 Tax=Candidatus Arcticimaribacter forsetii TaxID=2820661 RepID=UPI002076E043|nr:mannonate dehydratase [Candidatus Arcticimaribacter forsetii]MDB2345493.1 mannonate dehydratase [Flavobacteriaceae bacterium]MDB4674851.1 mannonate dehydratase [Flavobacteriaceae bacterium]MDB4716909.1 mannonate dehydratase [Flavobacteriaceae bacterium]MDB4751123.1 mannonate dehydratase [Flavobacteriaceae bacterium]